MRVLIVEDESLAAEKLKRQLLAVRQSIAVVGWVSSVHAAVDWLGQHTVDLILMDIQLEDGISFQLFEQMEIEVPIIFTTAYDEFAIKAFQVNSLDYLLKPFKTSDLQRALDKYERWSGSSASLQAAYANLSDAMESPGGFRERFLVTVGEQLFSIELAEVAYFFAESKYVFLVRPDGRQHVLDLTLDQLEQQLNPAAFFRINRKYLVHRPAIQAMVHWTKSRVKLELTPPAQEETIVSVGRSPDFRRWMGK